jgi:hypothetical protein
MTDHPLCTDPTAPLEVTRYVRGDVSAPSRRRIESVRRRLDALSETRLVDATRTEQWPPRRHAIDPESDTETCGALVDRLERWADDAGYSLRPAIRRHAPGSLLDEEPSAPGVCVPVMLLAFERVGPDASGLAGVAPYTVPADDGDATTYTVADWLAAAERAVGADTGDARGRERVRPRSYRA